MNLKFSSFNIQILNSIYANAFKKITFHRIQNYTQIIFLVLFHVNLLIKLRLIVNDCVVYLGCNKV